MGHLQDDVDLMGRSGHLAISQPLDSVPILLDIFDSFPILLYSRGSKG